MIQRASKEGRRGRAKGGISMGIRRRLEGKEGGMEEEELMIKEIKWGGEKWKVGTVHKREIGEVKRRSKGKERGIKEEYQKIRE